MSRKHLTILLFLGVAAIGRSQDYEALIKAQDSIYQINIKKSRINGVYIPESLEDAFKELDELSTPEARLKFKNAEEEMVARKLHFGLGRWMSYNWNFEEGSRLSHILRGYGIHNPDDMINFMLRSYHRHLNGKDQEIAQRAADYIKEQKKRVEKNLGASN